MIPAAAHSANAREARLLLRGHRYGALSTLSAKFDGHPFGSITPYLVDHDGSLLILISTLAEHTRNIAADPRVSLITHNQHSPEIQAQGRVTLLGTATRLDERGTVDQRYLRYFPEARRYLAMHDFSFYRIHPSAIRYIGGFGHIHWVKPEDYLDPAPLTPEQEQDLLQQASALPARTLSAACARRHDVNASEARFVGIDHDGCDLRADDRTLRFDFPQRMEDGPPIMDAVQALFTPDNC